MKPFRFFAAIFLILWGVAAYLHFQSIINPPPDITIDWRLMKQVVPGATAFRRSKTEKRIYEALGPFQERMGYAFYTKDFVKGINGYGGPIEMVVGIDRQGTITGIKITKQQETSAFIEDLAAFLKRITGRNIREPLVLGKNIDGITSATITSTAIVSTLNAAAQKITSKTPLPKESATAGHIPRIMQTGVRVCVGLILILLSAWACTARKKFIRWTALLFGFIFLGILTQDMLSTSHVAGIMLLQVPGGTQSLRLVLLTATVITCLIFGRSYCAGVCPFGFVEEALFTINRKLFKADMSPDKKTDERCRWIKYIILTLVLTGCIVYQKSGLGSMEAYVPLFTGIGNPFAWAMVICVLIASFFFLRFWCRYLCPFGAFLGLISQFRIQKEKQPSALDSIAPVSLCAMPAECFYCDRCSRGKFNQSSRRQNKFFIIMITFSCLLFTASFGKSLYNEYRSRVAQKLPPSSVQQPAQAEQQAAPPAQKDLATPRIETYSKDSATAKEKLREAGITPHPAQYWKAIGNE